MHESQVPSHLDTSHPSAGQIPSGMSVCPLLSIFKIKQKAAAMAEVGFTGVILPSIFRGIMDRFTERNPVIYRKALIFCDEHLYLHDSCLNCLIT